MTLDEYTLALGKVIVNLHSLEFALRNFLWNEESPQRPANWPATIGELVVGQVVAENAFTNYDSLGRLINKFNAIVSTNHPQLCVDPSIIGIRDALAHGRLSAAAPNPPLLLVKFSKPANGSVTVTSAELMDEAWLTSETTSVRNELDKVVEAGRAMQPTKWPAA